MLETIFQYFFSISVTDWNQPLQTSPPSISSVGQLSTKEVEKVELRSWGDGGGIGSGSGASSGVVVVAVGDRWSDCAVLLIWLGVSESRIGRNKRKQ